jgi:hypothetical protein
MRAQLASILAAALALGCSSGEPAPRAAAVPTASAPPASPNAPTGVVTGHPRLWLTAADLPRLRRWASPKNPAWKGGLDRALRQALVTYDKDFFPGGVENAKWPDSGGDTWTSHVTEAYALMFAFASLVDPDEAARPAHTERARKLLMHVIREAEKGPDPDRAHPAPYRGMKFATYDRAKDWGQSFPLTVDWIHGSLSAADKASIRKVFLRWSDECVHATTFGTDHPEPIGVVNDKRLLADRKRLRSAGNNYFTSHMRQLTLMGLALDEAEDPPEPGRAKGELGGTLRSYLDNAVGAWLYQQYAIYEEPAVAAAALGVPQEGLGVASGGLSPEGFLYGASLGWLHQALLGLHTAGLRDDRQLGPQIRLIESAYWDRWLDGFLHSISPTQDVKAYHGQAFGMFSYGDLLRSWITPELAAGFASLAVYDGRAGKPERAAKARWIVESAMEGGSARMAERLANIWGNGDASDAILQFMMLDPEAPPPPDPRPALPLVFFDRALGRLVARSGWGPEATVFAYKCSWSTIGHQFSDANQIELYRKGEWLVKERSGYANDLFAMLPENHNTLSIENVAAAGPKPADLQWFEEVGFARGGQFGLGNNLGDPAVRAAHGPGYAVVEGDATALYNRRTGGPGGDALDVVHASRTAAWVAPDRVVLLDRAASRSEGKKKQFHLTFVGEPVVDKLLTTVTTPRGQQLFVHTLLPAGARIGAGKAALYNRLSELEPTRYRMRVEDPAHPREVRFLHVLEGADAGQKPSAVETLRSSAGTAYVGAAVGSVAVMFKLDAGAVFERVTFRAPAAVSAQIVTGLVPGAVYEVKLKKGAGGVEVTVEPGGSQRADEAGAIVVGSLKGG